MNNRAFILIIILIFCYSIGYGYFKIDKKDNNIKYSDINSSSNVSLLNSDNNISYNASLNYLGDSFYIEFYIENNNDFDMIIDNYNCFESEYIDYKVVYEDGSKLNKGDIIKSNSNTYVKIICTYVNISDEVIDIPTSFNITYSQV